MIEEYRDVPGYDGVYQVSDLGNVKSFKGKYQEGIILKANKTSDLKVINT